MQIRTKVKFCLSSYPCTQFVINNVLNLIVIKHIMGVLTICENLI